jgi:hypothetical protein
MLSAPDVEGIEQLVSLDPSRSVAGGKESSIARRMRVARGALLPCTVT